MTARLEVTAPVRALIARSVCAAVLLAAGAVGAAEPSVVGGMVNPESVVVGGDGRIYVSEIGGFGKDGDGKITVIGKAGQPRMFAQGLDDPKGIARFKHTLYVADKTRIWKIDGEGRATVFAAADAFPAMPRFLNDLTLDSRGNLYVSDTGDTQNGGKGAIYRINAKGKVTLVIDEAQDPRIKNPNGLLFERPGKLLVVDFTTGELFRLDVAKRTLESVGAGFGGGDGIARDAQGTLYISDWKAGRVWKLDPKRKNAKPQQYDTTFQAAADISLSADQKSILVPDMKAGTLTWLPR